MSKKNRREPAAVVAVEGEVPVVGMREPCPCGSGRRYKACHGRSTEIAGTARPFEGLQAECDIVALREVVPAATAPLRLAAPHADRTVTLVTVLPMAYPALVRSDGEILLALQVNTGSGDASRDLGDALAAALDTPAGEAVSVGRATATSPRFQDLIVDAPLDITVHDTFDFWIENGADVTDEVRSSIERASSYASPSAKLTGLTGAYWTQMGEKEHLRWFMPHPEEKLLDALARLKAAGTDDLGEGTKLVGMFRAQGLVCPVWDLPLGMGADATVAPATAFGERLAAALAVTTPLTDDERRARASLTTRQVTLR